MTDYKIRVVVEGEDRGATKVLEGAGRSLKDFGSSMVGLGGKLTAGITAPLLGLGGGALKIASDFEQVQVAFNTMLGDAGKAQTLFNDIKEFSASTPFEFPEVVEAGRKLLAFGVGAEDITATMRRLGDVAAGVGAPLREVAEIYGKARVQGRLFAEDINQLTGRGIPILGALAQVMGVNESAIKKMVEEGKVGFPELEAAFKTMTDQGGQFSGLMQAQSQTLGGLFSTLKDTVTFTLADIGKTIVDTFDLRAKLAGVNEFLSGLSQQISAFAKNNPELFRMGLIFAGIAAAIGPVVVGVGMLVGAIAPLAPVLGVVGAVLGALVSPLGLVAAAIAALAYFDVGGIGTAFAAGWAAVPGILESLRPGFEELLGWISAATQGDFSPLQQGLQGALAAVSATIQEFRWADFVTPLTDWGAYIVNLPWGEYITALNDWGAYITALAWGAVLPVLTDWGAYIVNLDWTAIIVQMVDWATWIPALGWAAFVTALAWGGYIVAISLKSFVTALTWENFVKAIEWGVYLAKMTWAAYIKTVEWGAWLVKIAWASFVAKVQWLDFIAKLSAWSSFIPPLTWSSFVARVDLASYIPNFGSWYDYISTFFSSAGASAPPTSGGPQAPAASSPQMGGLKPLKPNNSTGTSFFPGGLSWIGEKGPELVSLPRGSQIYNHERSAAMQPALAGAGAGGPVTIINHIGSKIDEHELLRKLADMLRRGR